MFEEIFSSPAVLRRHREGPLPSERQEYLQYLKDRGAATGTVIRQVGDGIFGNGVFRFRARVVMDYNPFSPATPEGVPKEVPSGVAGEKGL